MTQQPLRIAMWSGPRNMSTTMMRSFGARADTVCVDEPFYAAYLQSTDLSHPMREEILAGQENDPDRVAEHMLESLGNGAAVFYQKQMTHHMVDGIPRAWMAHCRNVFLIRHPARVIASYARKMPDISLDAIGFPQQLELFEQARAFAGETPLVFDSDDILKNPADILCKLCAELGIEWKLEMLHWPAGARAEDGPWAPHWYDAVWRSTGFGPAPGPLPDVPSELEGLYRDALEIYQKLAAGRIQ